MSDDYTPTAVELATELTVAWLGNPNTRSSAEDVPAFLRKMHDTLGGLIAGGAITADEAPAPPEYTPAVSVRKSLASKDHIISMIDGKPYRTLRRHLATKGMTPDEYRQRYGLKKDYPMVAESYSISRREMAHKIGLGRKPGHQAKPAAAAGDTPSKAPRRAKATKATNATTGTKA